MRAELASRDRVRGEITLLVEALPVGPKTSLGPPERIAVLLARMQAEAGLDEKDALKRLARERGVSKSDLYRELQRERAQRK